jgi:hypothetical protein
METMLKVKDRNPIFGRAKKGAKMDKKKYKKSRKLDILLNFRQVWDIIKLKTRAFYRATLHTILIKISELFSAPRSELWLISMRCLYWSK